MEESKYCNLGDVCNTISETYRANSSKVVLINTSDVLEGACLNHEKVENKDLKGQFKKVFHQNDILYSEIRPANKRFAFMEELKEYRLEEIGTIVGGATPSTKEQSYYDGNISWITPKDLSNYTYRFISRGKRMISQNGFDSCSCKMLPKGSILFSSRAPIGYIAIAENELCTNQGFKSIIPNNRIVDNMFLFYLLEYNKHAIEGMGSGTTFKEVSGDVMKKFKVRIPCLQKQKQIASVLSIIDEKIELNRRINDNLEQQAQALFKSWFVDFEPFKDGKFINSELGRIPEGWKVEPLINFCSEITRGNIPSYVEKSGFPILNQKVNKGFYLDKQYYKYNAETSQPQESKLAHKWDILLNSLGQGTLGRVHFYKDEKSNIIVDQFITILRANIFIKSAYLAFTLNRPEYQAIIESNITGSTGMWVLTINNIRKIKIVSPPISELSKISNLMENLYLKMNNNTKEQEELSILRDSLLPKLMSGELKINDLNN